MICFGVQCHGLDIMIVNRNRSREKVEVLVGGINVKCVAYLGTVTMVTLTVKQVLGIDKTHSGHH